MAERLTEKIFDETGKQQDIYEWSTASSLECNRKLGKLEDIMEKYDIGIQNLDYILEDYSKNQGRDFAICEERDTLRQERDTWQKACELACKELEKRNCFAQDKQTRRIVDLKDYFYQQAKQFAGK